MEKLDLTTVFVAQGLLAAEVIKGKLESAGIPVLLAYESVGPIYGLTVDGLGQVRVQVPREYAEDAAALLADEGAVHE
ncbi:MAG: putative signal transducing protein [Anaerolineae bacterium]